MHVSENGCVDADCDVGDDGLRCEWTEADSCAGVADDVADVADADVPTASNGDCQYFFIIKNFNIHQSQQVFLLFSFLPFFLQFLFTTESHV